MLNTVQNQIQYIKMKNVLFHPNWIRNGILKVAYRYLVFIDGIFDDNDIQERLISKQNMYLEIMIGKDALRPSQQNLIRMQKHNNA